MLTNCGGLGLILRKQCFAGRELVATSKLDRWRAIVTISGDGLFHEVSPFLFYPLKVQKICSLIAHRC